MRRKIMVIAPAKVNLTLDVKYKRADGYHELETVMHQIDLVDRLYFEEDHDIKVASDSREIPLGEQNLVYKAAKSILVKYGIKAGVKIFIEKNIPVAAGLAGGSTDAAAVLLGWRAVSAILGIDTPARAGPAPRPTTKETLP